MGKRKFFFFLLGFPLEPADICDGLMQMELKKLTCVMHGKYIDINHDGLLLPSIVKVVVSFSLSPREKCIGFECTPTGKEERQYVTWN